LIGDVFTVGGGARFDFDDAFVEAAFADGNPDRPGFRLVEWTVRPSPNNTTSPPGTSYGQLERGSIWP